jgi:uncharacterized low-complexity protein
MNNRNFKDLIMKYSTAKPLAAVLGAAFVAAMTQVPATQAAENPFATTELQGGYKVAAQHEGKCGEGKCGEGKCGEGHKSASEGKKEAGEGEGKRGEEKSLKEGKCGGG